MIFISESGLTDPSRIAEWNVWYRGHLAAMVAVPGVTSAQRFRVLDDGPPPSLAMYSVASPAVFDSAIYLPTRGRGPFLPVVDHGLHRRHLFDGLDAAPDAPMGRFGAAAPPDRRGHAAWLCAPYAEAGEGGRWTSLRRGPYPSPDESGGFGEAACRADDPLVHTILDNNSGEAVGTASYMRTEPSVGVIEIGSITFSPRTQSRPAVISALDLFVRRSLHEPLRLPHVG